MKKVVLLVLLVFLYSCSSKKNTAKPLYEILTSKNDGGGNINFYEIVTEKKEMKMLLSDSNLKGKIRPEDVEKSNFIILNMGELPKAKYTITVVSVEETPTSIVVHVKETKPDFANLKPSGEVVYPYTIVKINSKKPVLFK